MTSQLPILLVPGLNCSARIYANQIPALWQFGPVTIANHRDGDSMAAIARSILAHAPDQFALVGFSMGGYIAFEILRQARSRVARLALIDSSARPDTPEQTKRRNDAIAHIRAGRFRALLDGQFPLLVHASRREDAELRRAIVAMAEEECGAELYLRHVQAVIARPDSRPELAAIRVPTTIVVGDSDQITVVPASEEMAAGIAGAKLVVVPECGHMSPWERPQAVTRALVDWLNDAGRERAAR